MPSDGCGMKMNELEKGEFRQIREKLGTKFVSVQNPDPPLGSACFSALIGTKLVPLACPTEDSRLNCSRACLNSENQTENVVQISNTEDLVDTRQAHTDTDVVLDTSRDPPDSGKHVRSGADSLAESVKSASDWTDAGVDCESPSGQGQPDSEFGCSKDHDFGFESRIIMIILDSRTE